MRIIPAILEKNLEEVKNNLDLIKDLASLVQIDIMDGQFVAGKSVDLADLKALEIKTPLEIHLMVNNPEDYFETCQSLGVRRVFWHYSAVKDRETEVFNKAGFFSFQKGLAINPEVELDSLNGSLEKYDAALVMGVRPGSQGQAFLPETASRVKLLKSNFPKLTLGVDGGVSQLNIVDLKAAGAEDFMIGSALFKTTNLKEEFNILTKLIS